MKIFMLLICFLALTFYAKSQDTIVQLNGQIIVAKVLEITPEYVKYKNYNNIDGPLITIQKSSVNVILNSNGTKTILNEKPIIEKTDTEVQYNKIDKNNKVNATTVTYSKVEYNRTMEDNKIFNLIKANPLLILAGDIPIYYERRIGDRLGIEVGIGPTLTDYFTSLVFDENIDGFKTVVGYSFSSGLHLFTSKHYKGLEDLYFSPEFRIRKYYSELINYGGIEISPGIDQSRTLIDFQIKIGLISYWSDNVSAEYYCGIGIRNRIINKADVQSTSNYLTITMKKSQDLIPCISAGVKIGFGW